MKNTQDNTFTQCTYSSDYEGALFRTITRHTCGNPFSDEKTIAILTKQCLEDGLSTSEFRIEIVE